MVNPRDCHLGVHRYSILTVIGHALVTHVTSGENFLESECTIPHTSSSFLDEKENPLRQRFHQPGSLSSY